MSTCNVLFLWLAMPAQAPGTWGHTWCSQRFDLSPDNNTAWYEAERAGRGPAGGAVG